MGQESPLSFPWSLSFFFFLLHPRTTHTSLSPFPPISPYSSFVHTRLKPVEGPGSTQDWAVAWLASFSTHAQLLSSSVPGPHQKVIHGGSENRTSQSCRESPLMSGQSATCKSRQFPGAGSFHFLSHQTSGQGTRPWGRKSWVLF